MSTPAADLADPISQDPISQRLRSPDYRSWRAKVEASGGCAHPVRLSGTSTILDRDGQLLHQRAGEIFAPCGNRRESVCPACSHRYAGDAFHLIRAGLAGGDKGIPTTVTTRPRLFVTLTAPSFGAVHARRLSTRGRVIPCRCGAHHREHDPALGTPTDPDTYDYTGSVLWQAHAGKLWHRFTVALRRGLAARLGVAGWRFRDHARLSYAKVAEYQRRGLVHFHAAVRLDGPDGPTDPPPAGLTTAALRDAVTEAARTVALEVDRPDGTTLILRWGTQLDIRDITTRAADDEHGEITDASLAGYIAKYATKGTGKTDQHPDRPIRDAAHIPYLAVSEHHRRIIDTCWQLGGLDRYEDLNLRKWAHMLGFRGHFLTKSQRYSTTFRAMRSERRTWRLTDTLTQLGADTDDPDDPGDPGDLDELVDQVPDLNTVTVINDWRLLGIGHRTDAERELALAIAERRLHHRHTRKETRS